MTNLEGEVIGVKGKRWKAKRKHDGEESSAKSKNGP